MKAILVIDMPNSCDSCRFCVNTYLPIDNGYVFPKCIAKDFGIDLNKKHLNEVHKNCPLKPLPQKKELDFDDLSKYYDETEVLKARFKTDGYNACIDEILGEKE